MLLRHTYILVTGLIDIVKKTAACASVVSARFPKYPLANHSVFWEHCECVVLEKVLRKNSNSLFLLVMYVINNNLGVYS